jgi:YidC/Oxa1 family membrane protein insertase
LSVAAVGHSKEELAASGVTEFYSSEAAAEVANLAAATASSGFSEVPFSSIGLAHAYPSGWMQSLMETMHLNLDMPWWGTIVTSESSRTHTNAHLAPYFTSFNISATVLLRMVVFPLVILSQKSMTNMQNHQPQMQKFQARMLEATEKTDGNHNRPNVYHECRDNNFLTFQVYGRKGKCKSTWWRTTSASRAPTSPLWAPALYSGS